MKNILKTLTELQDVDTQLAEIEAHKGNLPQQVENLEAVGAEVKERLKAAQAKVESDKKELKTLGTSKDEYKTKLTKYQDQLYLVTTNREYDALTNEIETVKSHIQDIVDQQGILTEEVGQLEEEMEALTARQTELQESLAKSQEELAAKTDLTNARQKELEALRDELAGKLSRRYLRKYERILQVRGQAVVPVKRRACGGCHKQISDQLLFEIKQGNRFIECEGCGRILVYPDNEDDISSN
ncbi:MAG: hypothetical protein K9N34_06575 [Candidatus Marinimicrobia bacterium]|nr:hypothetical protein [Candidatus Neomarinimicrobiota bacterium]MCF7840283.1 hypothetical protein [Candidatus Neomarinimicrobiota bacterium]